jgi:hypothetical protein
MNVSDFVPATTTDSNTKNRKEKQIGGFPFLKVVITDLKHPLLNFESKCSCKRSTFFIH